MIKIICVGKIKENYLKEAISEYEKRLRKYTKLELIEVLDSTGDDISKILMSEKEKIDKHIQEKDYVITLEIEGKMLSSVEFSQTLDQITQHYANVTFIIGGSYGLDEAIKKRANLALSFSKLTFPHQLFRVLLLEQIYRTYRILNNESYHK